MYCMDTECVMNHSGGGIIRSEKKKEKEKWDIYFPFVICGLGAIWGNTRQHGSQRSRESQGSPALHQADSWEAAFCLSLSHFLGKERQFTWSRGSRYQPPCPWRISVWLTASRLGWYFPSIPRPWKSYHKFSWSYKEKVPVLLVHVGQILPERRT